MLIAVINQSTMVNDSDCEVMCKAIQIQLDLHFLPAWNMRGATISFYSDKTKVPGYAWLLSILDNSTQAGALGYHSLDDDKVDAFIFAQPILANGGTVMLYDANNPSQYTVSATVSHEVMEMCGDRYCNGFSVGPQIAQGNLYCQEMADPVEADNYGILVGEQMIAVSNFIFPSWFNPSATLQTNAPFDYLNKLTAPYTMDAGGYMIVASISSEGQVNAKMLFGIRMPEWRKETKRSGFARGGRRTS